MDINKITGGNIIPQGSEAFKKINQDAALEAASIEEKKPNEINPKKEEEKGNRIDFQA